MRKLLFGSLALTAVIVDPAMAADLPVKAPVYKAAPALVAYNWTGFYIGAHVGYGWSANSDATATPLPSPAAFGVPVLGFDTNGDGFVGGGQIGYNWQTSTNWVLGIELDISWTRIEGSTTIAPVPAFGGGFHDFSSAFMSRSLDWFGTVRGRVGYAWDRALLYITGGFAYGRVNYAANQTYLFGPPPPTLTFPASFSETKTGWTAGAGFEYALPGAWNSWSMKVEYLYFDLGSASATGTAFVAGVPLVTVNRVLYDWDDTKGHIVRVGLNYKLGPPAVVAKY